MQERTKDAGEGFTVDEALMSVLITTPDERAKWMAVDPQDDAEIRSALSFQIGAAGRPSSRAGICCIKVKPSLAFWFGSYAVGKPTFEGKDLVDAIRRNLLVLQNGNEAPHAAEPEALTQQLELFDYSQLDDDAAIAVRTATTEIQARMASVQLNHVEIGRKLKEVKALIQPGHFQEWLDKEFGFSRDSADRWIQVADYVDANPQIAEALRQKKFARTAVYLLAAPSTPESARQEVIARTEAGESMPPRKVRETVKRHKVAAGSTKPAKAKAPTKKPAAVKPKTEPVTDHQPESSVAGVCMTCGCTETAPCMVAGEPCGWTDGQQNECTACFDLTDSAWLRSTVSVLITLFPHDGDPRGRHVQVMARNDQDAPVLRFVRGVELAAFEGPVGETLERLKAELPERWRQKLAREKAEKQKAAREAERAKKARPKTRTSKPARKPTKAPARKPAQKKGRKR